MTTVTAGRELDALIAERVFARECEERIGMLVYREKDGVVRTAVPFYSTDIAAAWLVFEWLTTRRPDLCIGRSMMNYKSKWAIVQEDGEDTHNWNSEEHATAPLAICFAALKAVGHE